jgi:hypothetical protein
MRQLTGRLTDLDGSGAIDGLGETREVWNTTTFGTGYDFLAGFRMPLNAGAGGLRIPSNGGTAATDWVMRLLDLDGDGAFWGADEWNAVASVSDGGDFPDRARAVAFYSGSVAAVSLPPALPALALATGGLTPLRRRTAPL